MLEKIEMLKKLEKEITSEILILSDMVSVLEFIHTFKDEDLFTKDEACKKEWILNHMAIVEDHAKKLYELVKYVTFEETDALLALLIHQSRLRIEKIIQHYMEKE